MFRKAISHLLSALLLASVALLPTLARADPNADCNRNDGADSITSTDDDSLECGEDADASGGNATALGSQARASGDFRLVTEQRLPESVCLDGNSGGDAAVMVKALKRAREAIR